MIALPLLKNEGLFSMQSVAVKIVGNSVNNAATHEVRSKQVRAAIVQRIYSILPSGQSLEKYLSQQAPFDMLVTILWFMENISTMNRFPHQNAEATFSAWFQVGSNIIVILKLMCTSPDTSVLNVWMLCGISF